MANLLFSDLSDDSLLLLFYLGNGECNLQWNNIENYFDFGDCCLKDVKCRKEIQFGGNGGNFNMFDIIDDSIKTFECPMDVCVKSNIYCNAAQLGDGICQDYNNGPFCDFDLGDCCLHTPQNSSSCCDCDCKPTT